MCALTKLSKVKTMFVVDFLLTQTAKSPFVICSTCCQRRQYVSMYVRVYVDKYVCMNVANNSDSE